MVSATKIYLNRILALAGFISVSIAASTQVSITGPTCAINGTQYQYTISGSWNGSTSMSWCITNGYIVNNGGGSCKSGTPLPSIQVIFTTGTSGSVELTSSIGNSTKNVTIANALDAGSITGNQTQTIQYNTTPATISCSAASGGACSPSFSYQWQSSSDNVNWTDISGATSQNLSFSSGLIQTTYYRRKVTETTSGTIGYSPSATVFIAAPLQSGSISGGTSPLTYNTSPGQMTCGAASGGSCGSSYSYQWQQSSDNSTFTDISGVTSLSYTPGNLTQTTYYRVKVVCGSETAYSSVKTITVSYPLVPGEITTGDQLIAYNATPATINATAATNGNCGTSYSYQWQSSTDNTTFTDISGATGSNLTFSTGLTQTKYYRRKTTCSSEVKYTFSVKVEVAAALSPGSITGAQTIAYNTIPGPVTATSATGGACSGIYFYQWQQSTDGTNFTDITDAVNPNLGVVIPLIQNTYYKRKVTCSSETAYTSNILITMGFNPGILTNSQGINSGASPSTFQLSSTGGGNCGTSYSYQWEKSTDGYNWTIISGASVSTYSSGTLTATTSYRVKVTCSSISSYTNTIKVKILAASGTNIPTTGTASSSLTPATMSGYASGIDPANQNYIRTRTFFKPGIADLTAANAATDKFDVSQATEYYDGLGRPTQSIVREGTPAGKDMISASWYDAAGRVVQKYLPYTDASGTGNFRTDPVTQQPTFYNSFFNNTESFYYANTVYEVSPLNRPLRETAPGKSWTGNDRGSAMEDRSNESAEDVKIWTIGYTTGSLPQLAGAYGTGELYVKIITDEQENQVIEYKDKEGKVLLKKVQLNDNYSVSYTGWLCTYYVYDEMSKLRFVMQPRAVEYLAANSWVLSTTIANEFCFRYEYDNRGHMIVKKVPGADENHMVYDMRDRMVMSQDGNLRNNTQWSVIKYDDQNRPVKSGIISSSSTRSTHQTSAISDINYPTLNSADVYTEAFYDDYTWTSGISGISSSLNTTDINSTNFITSYDNNPIYAQQITSTTITRGMPTGNKTRIIGTTNYLYAVSFADEKGRAVQVQSTNISGGSDISTTQYDFSGKVLRNYLKHSKAGTNAQTHTVLSKNEYDHGGRLLRTKKTVNAGTETLIAQNNYDELGQLKKKDLGQKTDLSFLETLDYTYNIRGWLRGVNKDYANNDNSNGANNRWFGMELSYDFGYTKNQFNGNIGGMKWRSKGDGEQRSFGYDYDNVNRVLKSDFTQYTGSAWNTSAGFDFSMSNMSYDGNGNIITMNHKGWKLTGSTTIDQLTYNYLNSGNSNRLAKVSDAINDSDNGKLGDFKDGTNGTNDDYSYDVNGNLALDNNKAISSITYNHLNLPSVITVTGKGTITYTYNASGTKVAKTTTENNASVPFNGTNYTTNITTTTTYITGTVYESKAYSNSSLVSLQYTDKLQFINHEEGRIRYNPANTSAPYPYDYFIKDHLGNVRVVLTEEQQVDKYPVASLETAKVNTEDDYYTIDQSKIVDASTVTGLLAYTNDNGIGNNPSDPTFEAANSAKLYKLNSTTNKTGLGVTLKIMAGDKIDIFGKSYYFQNNTGGSSANSAIPVIDLLTGLLGSPGGAIGAAGHGDITSTQLNNNSNTTTGIQSLLTDQTNESNNSPQVPKAYINYLLFDEQFKCVGSGFSKVGSNSTIKNHYSELQNLTVSKNGYVYIYVSNESPVNVFFDNLQVVHTRGPFLEESHYYPFGLTMAGISSKALNFGGSENKYKYNGKELQNMEFIDQTGLEIYNYGYRMQDPQIGKFWQIDPHVEKYANITPYSYALSNPINVIDPDGRDAIFTITRNKKGKITGITISSTIYLSGEGASEDLAKQFNENTSNKFASSQFNGINVSFNVTYKYAKKKTEKDLTKGENLFVVLNSKGVSHVNSKTIRTYKEQGQKRTLIKTEYTTRTGELFLNGNKDINYTAFHESLHFLGLSDRYDETKDPAGNRIGTPHFGFAGSAMASSEYRLAEANYRDYVNYFQNNKNNSGVLKSHVDIDSRGALTFPTDEDMKADFMYRIKQLLKIPKN